MADKLKLISAPAAEPLSTAEAKAQLRVDFSDDDTIIDSFVTAARKVAEKITRRAFITQTWDVYLDGFPSSNRIDLPFPPLQSVTGVYYTPQDEAEAEFSSASYVVDTAGEPGGVVLKSGYSWPGDTLEVVNGVRVRFIAGYGDASTDVPENYISAIRLLLGHLYENRENIVVGQGITISELPMGVMWLLGFDRNFRFV